MKYTVKKTKLTYEQLKERFDQSITNNNFSKRDPNIPYYGGSFSGDYFSIRCVLPCWRGCLNGLRGKIIEEDGYCTLIYKINLPLGLCKIGRGLIAFALLSLMIAFAWIRFNTNFMTRVMTENIVFLDKLIITYPIFMPFTLLFGIATYNIKKEGEKCIEKLEEIIDENYKIRPLKELQKFSGDVKVIQAKVILIDNIHFPKLLVCQTEKENGSLIQYYKEKENSEFYEKIGDYVMVEVYGDNYKIIEKNK